MAELFDADIDLQGHRLENVPAPLVPTDVARLIDITDAITVAAAPVDGAAGTPSLRTLGTGAQQAAGGDDSRLSNNRIPTGIPETGGPTLLTFGAIADGKVFMRSGTTVVGANGGHIIEADAVALAARGSLNFKGAIGAVDPGAGDRVDVDLKDTAVTPAAYVHTAVTFNAKGQATAAASGAFIGSTGDTLIRVVPAAGRDDNDTVTPKIVGAFAFDPADHALGGTSRTIVFRAVAAAGNGTVTGRVKIRNVTDSVDVATLAFSGSSATQKVDSAVLAVPASIPNSEKIYEVSIYVDAHAGGSDLITLYGAQLRIVNTVA